ncbi:MAG TPA: hypothetical protein VHR45_09965 [Thermoanaerobaculia bacterium]|nr:hypothetical protein [Thermoanaerobaculia bacterium]
MSRKVAAQRGHLMPASGLAEIPLQLWLLVKGVNDQRWKEQASAAGEWQAQRAVHH